MVSGTLATLDLVTRGDAWLASPAAYLGGRAVLSCGELTGLAGGSGPVLRRVSKALVLHAGDRDLPALHGWRASQDDVRDWRPSPYTGPAGVVGLSWSCR